MRNFEAEVMYCVFAYTEPADKRLTLAENINRERAWEIARQAMNDNPNIYAVSVKTQAFKAGTQQKLAHIEQERLAQTAKGGNNE